MTIAPKGRTSYLRHDYEKGCGNAVIRPYSRNNPANIRPRSAGIPTGSRRYGGFQTLSPDVKMIIDAAIEDVNTLITKHDYKRPRPIKPIRALRVGFCCVRVPLRLRCGPSPHLKRRRLVYSANQDGSLGTGLFKVGEDVRAYILDRLYQLTYI
jgi:hypothetical protein